MAHLTLSTLYVTNLQWWRSPHRRQPSASSSPGHLPCTSCISCQSQQQIQQQGPGVLQPPSKPEWPADCLENIRIELPQRKLKIQMEIQVTGLSNHASKYSAPCYTGHNQARHSFLALSSQKLSCIRIRGLSASSKMHGKQGHAAFCRKWPANHPQTSFVPWSFESQLEGHICLSKEVFRFRLYLDKAFRHMF